MSRPKNFLGLSVVKIGAVGADGGMGTTLTEVLGATVKGSASLVLNEGSYEDVEIEEEDVAYDEVETAAPKWVFNLESYNVSAKALSDLGAGTLTPGATGAPDSIGMDTPFAIERSVEALTRNGAKLQIARMKIRVRPQFDAQKGVYAKVIITGTPLKPTKAGVATIIKTDAPA
ncbi:hypothetical protein [Sphingobacterium thalpophilum]|uniref:hypothetical protein n=1 Tax=Sphingobacterium thalpophilum TaxID=259 RepID=UPI003D9723DC